MSQVKVHTGEDGEDSLELEESEVQFVVCCIIVLCKLVVWSVHHTCITRQNKISNSWLTPPHFKHIYIICTITLYAHILNIHVHT